MRLRLLAIVLLAALFAPTAAWSQASVYMCVELTSGIDRCQHVSVANPLPVTGSFSATTTGFHEESVQTPITATTGGVSSAAFTAGKVVVVTNAGTTNIAYCQLGASATTSGQPIAPNGGWFAFTSTSETLVTCATSTSTTTVNFAVGTGLPTGTGGGGGSGGGGGGAITAASGAYASGSIASGALAVGAGADGWDVGVGATTATAPAVGAAGSVNAKLRLMTSQLDAISTAVTAAIPAGTNTIGTAGQLPYPVGATPITASATGTTGATTATLAGTSGKTTYICGYSIRANATAAATVTNTITGVITATLSSVMWVAPLASGIGLDEMIFSPCIPASATNTGIAIVSGAPGSGGTVSSKGWGYQL